MAVDAFAFSAFAVSSKLAPDWPIFAGAGHLERTIVHEFAHHLSNNRNPVGFRSVLERAFGRVLPFDALSAVLWYLSTPAHQTMPSFWQEGLAQWAETTYVDPTSPWIGVFAVLLLGMSCALDRFDGLAPDMAEAPLLVAPQIARRLAIIGFETGSSNAVNGALIYRGRVRC